MNQQDAKTMMRTMDAFISATTGAGVLGHDKFKSYYFAQTDTLDDTTLEALFTDDDLAATIVERIVHDALRSGYELDWQGASDEQRRDVKDWAEGQYGLTEETKRARVYGRLFGGGAVFVGIEGEPLNQAILGQDVKFLRAVASTDLRGSSWYSDVTSQDFGQVATYKMRIPTFQPVTNGSPVDRRSNPSMEVEIHESRFVPFYGVRTTDQQQWKDKGWGKSVLHRVYDVLMKFETSFDSVLHTLSESSIPVYKVKALLDLLASENGELLAKRFELINAAKGSYRAVILDQEEELIRVEANLGQSSAVVDAAMIRVSGAAGIPAVILFGRSPAGQNATGASDLENWNQQVASEQSLVLGPAIARLYRYLLSQTDSPLNGMMPDDLKVVFPAVETPSLQDQINQYAQLAGADVAYVNAKVLTPEQVALKRTEQTGQFPNLDKAAKEFAREMMELRQEQMLNPPDPMQMMQPGQEDDDEPDDDDDSDPPRD